MWKGIKWSSRNLKRMRSQSRCRDSSCILRKQIQGKIKILRPIFDVHELFLIFLIDNYANHSRRPNCWPTPFNFYLIPFHCSLTIFSTRSEAYSITPAYFISKVPFRCCSQITVLLLPPRKGRLLHRLRSRRWGWDEGWSLRGGW